MSMGNLVDVVNQIAADRGINADDVFEALKRALKEAYLKEYPDSDVDVEINKKDGEIYFVVRKRVVKEVKDPNKEISLKEAKKYNPNIKEGTIIEFTQKVGILGRIAAQVAKRVITRVLRDSQLKAIIEYYKEWLGKIVSGKVTRVTKDAVIVELEKGMAIMPKEEQVEREFYEIGSRYKFLLKELINEEFNRRIILSRRDPRFIEALFEMEIPELSTGQVEIVKVARVPGVRSKVAVRSIDKDLDPIGTFIGPKGVRIAAVMDELQGEKVDIVKWDFDIVEFIKNAFSPATVQEVKVDEKKKKAKVFVAEEQYPIALGKDGVNIHLVSDLVGYDIEVEPIKSEEGK